MKGRRCMTTTLRPADEQCSWLSCTWCRQGAAHVQRRAQQGTRPWRQTRSSILYWCSSCDPHCSRPIRLRWWSESGFQGMFWEKHFPWPIRTVNRWINLSNQSKRSSPKLDPNKSYRLAGCEPCLPRVSHSKCSGKGQGANLAMTGEGRR